MQYPKNSECIQKMYVPCSGIYIYIFVFIDRFVSGKRVLCEYILQAVLYFLC
jgi:hypothetical protein